MSTDKASHTHGKIKAKGRDLMLATGRYRMASGITACGSASGLVNDVEIAFENARRLAACWNFCDGISTEELEARAAIAKAEHL